MYSRVVLIVLENLDHPVSRSCLNACCRNLGFYAKLAVVGLFGLVLLLWSGMMQITNVIGFGIAASNAYGLIMGMCCIARRWYLS